MGRVSTDMSDISIGLVQINSVYSVSGETHYLPYSVGLLQAYIQANSNDPGRYNFLPLSFGRQPVHELVDKLNGADMVGFSLYAWNSNYSLEVAKRLKRENPNIRIIVGGPHVPDRSETFLRENDFIDVAVHKEGEQTFLDLVERFPRDDWREAQGTSHIDRNNAYQVGLARQRFREIDEIPSPYLSGIFDSLIEDHPHVKWAVLWETNRGCPFQCTFCDWGSNTAAKLTRFGIDRLRDEIDWFCRNGVDYIFCCDANFGIMKRDVEIAKYAASVKQKFGNPKTLFVQATKNATERAYETQKILHEAGLGKGVALSMQSMDQNTLKSIKRDNISLETYLEMQRRFAKQRVETYTDLIIGLPGETYDSLANGVDTLITSGQHNRINFQNLAILPNAEMGDPEYQKRFGMELVRSKIGTIHGAKVEIEDDVLEEQDLVISTNTMGRAAWLKTRTFCWIGGFYYFDKLCQLPILITHQEAGVSLRKIFECFVDVDEMRYPILAQVRDFFQNEARLIQEGGSVFKFSDKFLGIHWHPNEIMYMTLRSENTLDRLYDEVRARLLEVGQTQGNGDLAPEIIDEAILVNRSLLKAPYIQEDLELPLTYNVWEFYKGKLYGEDIPLQKQPHVLKIIRTSETWSDFNSWCREVVWFAYTRGAYYYECEVLEAPSHDYGGRSDQSLFVP